MAKLYIKNTVPVQFACYSERALMSYFMFKVLPTRVTDFLTQIRWPERFRETTANLRDTDISRATIFGELHFGEFGSRVGAIFVQIRDVPILLLIEVKLNETFEASCRKKYPSSIKGQIELKWRLMSLFKSDGDAIQVHDNDRYVVETDTLIRKYSRSDRHYPLIDPVSLDWKHRRRLKQTHGVKAFFDQFVQNTPPENILYMAITTDSSNPFDVSANAPMFIGTAGNTESSLERCCWLNTACLEDC